MKTVAVHHRDTTNLGDLVCSPALYFDLGDVEFKDVREPLPKADRYVFGGGAMFRRLFRTGAQGIKIAWGVGQTVRKATTITDPIPDDFTLFGSRDVGQRDAEWVPCASCMSDLFDREYEIDYDAVAYWNYYPDKTVPKPDVRGVPSLVNRCSFEEAVRFLGSGKRVVTNSYHGAYWGALLGREVVIVGAYSSKFFGYRHQPAVSDTQGWSSIKTRVFPEALDECRTANLAFYEKVRNVSC
jgi:hypothetical protein